MFDENGIWQDQIYPTAGPSGGATGALDLMNVMQSGQNYNQEHAAKMQYLLLKMLSDRNAQAAVNSPYAAQALEMKPEDVQSAYAQTPEARFQSLYGQMTPEDQIDPEAIMRAGFISGAEQPNAGLASSVKLQESYRKGESSANTNWTKVLDQARKAIASRSDPQEGARIAEAIIRNGGTQYGIPDDQIEQAVQNTTKATAGMGIDPLVQNKIDLIKATKDYRELDASLLPPKIGAQISALDSMTRLHDVDAALKNIDLIYAKHGQISPALAARLQTALTQKEAQIDSTFGLADMMMGSDPEMKATREAYRDLGKKTLQAGMAKLAAITASSGGSATVSGPQATGQAGVTATNAKGQKVQWNGTEWVPLSVPAH